MACSYCGGDNPTHPESGDQYGEPVCESCFNESYTGPDPTNDAAYGDTSRALHLAEFHTARSKGY